MSANDIRKNFVFKKEIAEHLEELAKRDGKSMTTIIQELVEEKYQEISKEEKLEALYKFAGSSNGDFKDLKVQDIKAMMGEEKLKRCQS